LKVIKADIAALARQTVGDAIKLLPGKFHTQRKYPVSRLSQLVLTGPRRYQVLNPRGACHRPLTFAGVHDARTTSGQLLSLYSVHLIPRGCTRQRFQHLPKS
jgi:hypothetical protein